LIISLLRPLQTQRALSSFIHVSAAQRDEDMYAPLLHRGVTWKMERSDWEEKYNKIYKVNAVPKPRKYIKMLAHNREQMSKYHSGLFAMLQRVLFNYV
jgi:hypothetical protein